MTLDPELRKHLAGGDVEPIENAWLTRLEAGSQDLRFFGEAARALSEHGHEETARSLLELLDEQLLEEEAWDRRLDLLRRVGSLLKPGETLHPEILRTLEALYGSKPSFAGLIDKIGLHRGIDDLVKTWRKVERFETLIHLDRGAVVEMEGKGAGRVVDLNLRLESIKIDFPPPFRGLSVGFAAAGKLLRALAPSHIQSRKLEDEQELLRLREERPEELLRITLESYQRPLSANEIRKALSGIVPEEGWSAWWSAVRQHPQVVVVPGGRHLYAWAESRSGAVDALWERFRGADLKDRLDLFRSQGERDPRLKERMVEELLSQGGTLGSADPAQAFELAVVLQERGVDLRNQRCTPEELLSSCADIGRLLAGIEDRASREHACRLLPEIRPDWAEALRSRFLLEEDPRVLDLLARTLEARAPEELSTLLTQLVGQPHRAPAAFAWLAERAAHDEGLRGRFPLRLLQQILGALGDPSFQRQRRRLEALAESGSTLPRLLAHLDAEQAAQADEALKRAPGLASYQRQPLRNALHLRFPTLRETGEMPLYATPEAIESRRQQLQHLLEVEIPANRRAIREARELGDLSENFEYKSARQRHEYLSALVARLQRDLGRVQPIDASDIDTSEVRVGTRVRLVGPTGEERVFTLLGPWDSRPDEGILSNEADLSSKLLGRKVGNRLEGTDLMIRSIEPFRPPPPPAGSEER